MINRGLYKYASCIMLGIVLVAGAGLWYWQQPHQPPKPNPSCIVDGSTCYFYLDDDKIAQLDIAVSNQGNLQPMAIRLVEQPASMVKVERASVELVGLNRYMGINIYPLRENSYASPSEFIHKGVLPSCIESTMHWRAGINLVTSSGEYTSQIEFTTKREI